MMYAPYHSHDVFAAAPLQNLLLTRRLTVPVLVLLLLLQLLPYHLHCDLSLLATSVLQAESRNGSPPRCQLQ